MELKEFLLAVEHLLEELLSALTTAHFLTQSHLSLEAVESARFFLTVGENALTFVEVTVDELSLEKVVSIAFSHQFRVGMHVCLHIRLNLLSKRLLLGV